jgi:hypothetical protein
MMKLTATGEARPPRRSRPRVWGLALRFIYDAPRAWSLIIERVGSFYWSSSRCARWGRLARTQRPEAPSFPQRVEALKGKGGGWVDVQGGVWEGGGGEGGRRPCSPPALQEFCGLIIMLGRPLGVAGLMALGKRQAPLPLGHT